MEQQFQGSDSNPRPGLHPARGRHARGVLPPVPAGTRGARRRPGLRWVPARRRLGPAAPRDGARPQPTPAV